MSRYSRDSSTPDPSRLPSIAEWLRGEPNPWPGIDEPGEGARFAGCYVVESKQLLRTKDDKPYLRIQLSDRSGSIEGRVWDDAERIDAIVEEGAFVGVVGRIQSFRGQRQLKVEELAPISVAEDELDLFLPATDLDLEELESALDQLIESVGDPHLRALLLELVGRESESGRAFRRSPAAKRNHHAYIGGLIEHTVSITRIADALATHYGEIVDRDLLIAGAILHDIGKIEEISATGGFPYTDSGKLLGHIILGIEIVREAASTVPGLDPERLLLLLHLIASHQGKYEWQSPRIPHTIEALILHFADDIDAKVNHAIALVESVEEGWTPYDKNFSREFYRHGTRPSPARLSEPDPFGPDLLAPEAPVLAEQVEAERVDAEADEVYAVENYSSEAEVYDVGLGEAEVEEAEVDESSGPGKVERVVAGVKEPAAAKAGKNEVEEEEDPIDRAQVTIFDLL